MPQRSSQTLFIGNHIIKLNEVDSTNTFALSLLRGADVAEGAVITARVQTSGRGQRGNSWFSEPGKNITCSIILKPVFLDISLQFDLTRAIALGISDLLSDLLPSSEIRIKWPNDIIADGKKVAGILIENVVNGTQVSASVAGIGLNVNQSGFGPDNPHAVSVFQLTGREFEIEEAMQHLFAHIEARYLQLRAGKIEKLREDYHARLFKRDVVARYTDFKTIFDAILERVSEEGMLCLRCAEGVERRFGFKEVGVLY
ncbi:MAG TPA: biotin--[acetyl-CoA-carboxylase] ligase [Bacteroidia bacterium]|nr:biotin--[acetyl-CoA-carboxylase] ligase [Bacteroidia bacterium]